MGPMAVRAATHVDADAVARLRHALWPEGPEDEHRRELERLFARGQRAVLVAEERSRLLGFVELSIRAYAEGCTTDRVGFLEGWYVVPEARGRGVGRRLVASAEDWARSMGCTEFASDANAENEASAAAHRALGFEDAGLIRCFRKDL
jgi:aminoglycoside 6'-N-acetyltransferase I